MLKHHQHNGLPVLNSTSRRRRRSHLSHQTPSRSVPDVGIIPGNRFFLLPLKKVTALVRPHTPCREPSATKTKPCIISKKPGKQLQASGPGAEIHHRESLLQEFYARTHAHSKSPRLIAKQRRRRSVTVAKTPLSPVREQASGGVEKELLLEYERLLWNDGSLVDTRNCRSTVGVSNRSRVKDTSIFTWGEPTLLETCRGASLAAASSQMLRELNLNTATKKAKKKRRSNSFSNASDIDLVLYRSSRKTHTKSRFSVSPSTEREFMVSGGRNFGRNNRVSPSSLSHGQHLHPEFGTGNGSAKAFSKADEFQTPGSKNYRSSSRATSFSKANELQTPSLNKIRSSSGATRFNKFDELEIPRKKIRSKSMGNVTISTKADEIVPELETPCNKDSLNNINDNFTSFSKADELVTLCYQNRSNFRGNSTSFDNGDEIVKLGDKKRRKSRSHRKTSFSKGDEILIRDKKRRNFSFWGCSHHIRSCSPFLCSFTNKNDLPVGPSPLQLSRRLQDKVSVAQDEV